jgi:hypothetical protein
MTCHRNPGPTYDKLLTHEFKLTLVFCNVLSFVSLLLAVPITI